MNGLCRLLLILLVHYGVTAAYAQSPLYSFSTTNGTYYRDIRIIRIDDDSVLYSLTRSTGGGRLKFRDLPADIVAELRALKQRGVSFAESVAPGQSHSNVLAESASSGQAVDGGKEDAALLALNSGPAKLFCAFSREVIDNESRFLIVVNHDGPKFLDLNNQESLAFNVDGQWIKYSPLTGSFREELKDGRPIEFAAYRSSLPDIRKIGQAAALSIRVSGLTGEEDFSVPATSILKKFARFCDTNAPGAAVIVAAPPATTAKPTPPPAPKAPRYPMGEEEARLNQSPYFRTIVNETSGRVQQWLGHPVPEKLPGCRVTVIREFPIGGPASYRLGFEFRDTATNQYSLTPTNPVVFQIDGESFSVPNPAAQPRISTGPAGEAIQQWYSPATEELVLKLAAAKQANVQLPGETVFDYPLTRVELDRFALFARVFIGTGTATR